MKIPTLFISQLKYCLFSLFLISTACQAHSENSHFYFNHLSTSHGLSNLHVIDIIQDKMGFLWFGTENGLNRYDGNTFKTYRHDAQDPNSIVGSSVNCSLIDQKGNLWVGTSQGLSLYCQEKDYFKNFDTTSPLSENNIRCLYEDTKGIIWVGTRLGLIRFNRETNETVIYNKENANLSHNIVRAIHEDRKGKIWIGTFNGLNCFNPITGDCINFNLNPGLAGDPKNNLVTSIIESASDSIIYIGTETGFCHFNIYTYQSTIFRKENTPGIPNNIIKSMTRINEHTIWLGTDGGLLIYENGTFRSVLYNPFIENTLPNNVVWKIYKDNADIRWLATNNGIGKYDPQNNLFVFKKLVSPQQPQYHGLNIYKFLFQDSENCWLSTQYGLANYNMLNNSLKWYNSTKKDNGTLNPYRSIYLDKHGHIWIGASEGLTCFDISRNDFVNLNKFNLPKTKYNNKITALNDSVFWVGDLFGNLIKYTLTYKNNKLSQIETDSYYQDGGIWGILTDSDENLWILCKKGLIKHISENNTFINYSEREKDGFPACNNIYTFFRDDKNRIWIASDTGVFLYNKVKDNFVKAEAIPTGIVIYNIENDRSENLWFSTNKGILKYNPENKQINYHDLSFHKNFLQSISTSSGKDLNGNIYFGGIDGLVCFNPEKIKQRFTDSRLYITDVKLFSKSLPVDNETLNKQVSLTNKIVLPHDKNFLTFSFSLLDYTAPELTKYEYFLENFDKTWTRASEFNNQANYSNLSPGEYTFRVKAYKSDGAVNAQEAKIDLEIRSPWWHTWWAILIYLAIGILTIYIIKKQRLSKLELKLALDQEIQEREKAEEVNQIKLRFFTNISHEFRTPLSLLLGPLDNMLVEQPNEKNRKRLTLMRQNAERLLRLINQIIDFRKIENQKMDINMERGELISFSHNIFNSFAELAEKKNISLIFRTSVATIDTLFDLDKMDKILFNLLSNALKFTPESGKITLSISCDRDEIEISVKDSGIGIPEKDIFHIFDRFYQVKEHYSVTSSSSGIGLTLVKEFVELHGGDLQVRSIENEGSCFTIILPYHTSSSKEEQMEAGINSVVCSDIDIKKEGKLDKHTILFVEDNEEMLEYIQFELADIYCIITAKNGQEGLEKAINENPDLIVSDIMMPIIDGYELCERLKKDFLTSHIPVILLTAKAAEESVIKGYKSGADAYIGKPFSIRILNSRIQNLIQQRNVVKESLRRSIITSPKAYDKQSPDEIFLAKIVDLIEKNISDPDLNIHKVCSEIGVSHMQLYRKLKALVGQNINEFIRTIRLKKAAQLLTVKGFNVSEVMFEVGFNSRSYFSKCFYELYGTYPKEYMKKNGEQGSNATQDVI